MKSDIAKGIKEAHFWRWFFGTCGLFITMAISPILGVAYIVALIIIWLTAQNR
jgi:uncharacterized membrane protein YdcZ (DUF606 family)